MTVRVLHCITVYNGRAFVPRAIESAKRMAEASSAQVDVLILDDASPEPGWSKELGAFCKQVGVMYYCTPRNLGIPRNVNIGLLSALKGGYDYVTINNSDVIFPLNLIDGLLRVASQPNMGSVTASSNNVSIYSIPNEDPDRYLASQEVVDYVSDVCTRTFDSDAVDIPAGISFCIMMPTEVIRQVGIMDPCFGRGYCEETDWSLRSLAAGYRLCMAPGVFVYHQGRGSNQAAGLVSAGATTVPANEAIIDMRYPEFRMQVECFMRSGILERHFARVTNAIVFDAAKKYGYDVNVGWLDQSFDPKKVSVNIRSDSAGVFASLAASGFKIKLELDPGAPMAGLEAKLGGKPASLRVSDRQVVSKDLENSFAESCSQVVPYRYPSRV